ncbi:MAG: twitching motility protein PilT [Lentisphaerae bacterium GWF2_52_8]|nr:MAG: twitching motility protein PilT [Lentisphaerae bacterium GWF2_52_8]
MLFDTDVIIWALRGNQKAATAIDKSRERFISAVSYMELVKGVRDKRELRATKNFLLEFSFEILPISENVSHRAMVYMEEFALGAGIDLADAIIAATAAEHSMKLCTANAKHYKVVPDVELSVFKLE